MWKRFLNWQRAWNADLRSVLLTPELAKNIESPIRRRVALRLAELTSIERAQLHQFSMTYSGVKKWKAIVKCFVAFSAFGALSHLFFPSTSLISCVAISNVYGFSLLMALAGVWFNYRKIVCGRYKNLALTIVDLTLTTTVIVIIASIYDKSSMLNLVDQFPRGMIVSIAVFIAYTVLFTAVIIWRNNEYAKITAQLQLEAEREKTARHMSEAQLRLLQAQIEPHFLFNTLGAVQQLAEQGAPKAAELTRNLIAFLRASMAEMRSERISLSDEFTLVKAYLEVMKARLAHRLTFELSLPIDLAQIQIPSMALLTLAENAIKHGIEPALHGGTIRLSAEQHGEKLHIMLQDTGVGLSETPGAGFGLQNLRDRLLLSYGVDAVLSVIEAEQGGVQAEIIIPLLNEGKV